MHGVYAALATQFRHPWFPPDSFKIIFQRRIRVNFNDPLSFTLAVRCSFALAAPPYL